MNQGVFVLTRHLRAARLPTAGGAGPLAGWPGAPYCSPRVNPAANTAFRSAIPVVHRGIEQKGLGFVGGAL